MPLPHSKALQRPESMLKDVSGGRFLGHGAAPFQPVSEAEPAATVCQLDQEPHARAQLDQDGGQLCLVMLDA